LLPGAFNGGNFDAISPPGSDQPISAGGGDLCRFGDTNAQASAVHASPGFAQ